MFDGTSNGRSKVSLGGKNRGKKEKEPARTTTRPSATGAVDGTKAFIEKTQQERHERQESRKIENSAKRLQAFFRSICTLKKARTQEAGVWDAEMMKLFGGSNALPTEFSSLPPAMKLMSLVRSFLFIRKFDASLSRFARFASVVKLLCCSVSSTDIGTNYCSLALVEGTRAVWLLQVTRLCQMCLASLKDSNVCAEPMAVELGLTFRLLITLTDSAGWGICQANALPEARKVYMRYLCSEILLRCCDWGMYNRVAAAIFRCWPSAMEDFNAAAPGWPSPPRGSLPAVTVLATLALRPLSAPAPAGVHTTWQLLPLRFSAAVLALPLLIRRLPGALVPTLLQASPALVAALAKLAPMGVPAISASAHDGSEARGILSALSTADAVYLFGNLAECCELARNGGQQPGPCMSALVAVLRFAQGTAFSTAAIGDWWRHVNRQLQSLVSVPLLNWCIAGIRTTAATTSLARATAAPTTPATPKEVATTASLLAAASKTVATPSTATNFSEWLRYFQSVPASHQVATSAAICSFCTVFARLLVSWPSAKLGLLNSLAFSTPLVSCLWAWLKASDQLKLLVNVTPGYDTPQMLPRAEVHAVLLLFCSCYSHLLMVIDDEEFYDRQSPFPLSEVVDLSLMFKQFVFRRYWSGAKRDDSDLLLREAVTHMLHQLYDRNSRREFCPVSQWLERGFELDAFGISSDIHDSNSWVILREFPHLVPFEKRVSTFQGLIQKDRQSLGAIADTHVVIRRTHVVEDSFASLFSLGPSLKGTVRVHFKNEQGLDEAGIDIGGVFKEFLTTLIEKAFDPQYGLFKTTNQNYLYPNPSSHIVPDHLEILQFLGMIMGKAMYDGILVDLPFANFFLSKLLGKHNYVDELPSLDAELHKNLMFLKHYDGDVEDLCLFFSVSENEFGEGGEHELVPNGGSLAVTSENRMQYIHLMADYRLNQQIKKQCQAFLKGFSEIIHVDWIRFFNQKELQLAISGDVSDIDMDDLRAHTKYSGGYSDGDKVIKRFWKVVKAFSPKDKMALLKFVTSCSRPPLLGFAHLQPPFVIHRVSSHRSLFSRKEEERLPTASTCMNLLKLPEFLSSDAMREKLLYSIHSGAGFELS